MNKYSLHTGINKVDASKYVKPIRSLLHAEDDAIYYHQLATGLGFTAQAPLLGSACNSFNLISGLEKVAKQMVSGDLLMFSHSGHGSLVKDLELDEKSGWDQVLVLYDRLFIDDEFAKIWSLFPDGSRIIMITDSCHNGTVAKLFDFELGKDAPPPPTNASRTRGLSREVVEETFEKDIGYYKSLKLRGGGAIKTVVIHFAACKDMEICDDGGLEDSNGLFTRKFIATYDKGNFKGTYQSFFDALDSNCPNYQKPYLDLEVGSNHEAFLATEFLV